MRKPACRVVRDRVKQRERRSPLFSPPAPVADGSTGIRASFVGASISLSYRPLLKRRPAPLSNPTPLCSPCSLSRSFPPLPCSLDATRRMLPRFYPAPGWLRVTLASGFRVRGISINPGTPGFPYVFHPHRSMEVRFLSLGGAAARTRRALVYWRGG